MAKVVSPVGHDAFLTESRQMDRILRNFLTLSQPDPRIDSAAGDPTEYSI